MYAEQVLWQLDYERVHHIIKALHDQLTQIKKRRQQTDKPLRPILVDTTELLNRFYTELYGLLKPEEIKEIDVKLTILDSKVSKLSDRAMSCPYTIYNEIDHLFKLLMTRRQQHGLGVPSSIRKSTADRITSVTRGRE